MSHVIGIDIGSSGIKVGSMDREGNLGMLEYGTYRPVFPQPGWVEIDLEEMWRLVQRLVRKVSDRIREAGGKPEAISISCFCNASVFLGEDGRPLYNGILYMDQRTQAEADWIKANIPQDLRFGITKNRIEPGIFSVTSLLWMKNHRPDIYARIHRWGHLSSYILYRLTGSFVLDWTQASYTGLFDVAAYRWSETLCDLLGIDMRMLAEIVDPAEVVGRVREESGLAIEPIPVAAGGADTACSALSLGIRAGELFESVGTSNVITVCRDNPHQFDERFMNRCHVIKNLWLTHGAMSHPGSCVRWFRHTLLSREEAEQQDILERLAAESRPGANGIYFLPYMYGERTPIWDIHARGTFVGLDLNSTKGDMLQAVYEGCAYGLKQIFGILEQHGDIHCGSFMSIGGGAHNRHWSQIKANVLQKRIEVKAVSETAAAGACLLAGHAAGFFSRLEEGLPDVRGHTLFTAVPDAAWSEFYEAQYRLFGQLYPALKPFFAQAAQIRQQPEGAG
jgi:xylulokinase